MIYVRMAVIAAATFGSLGFAIGETKPFRACDNASDVRFCQAPCGDLGTVEFRVDVANRKVIRKWVGSFGGEAIYLELRNCAIFDSNNWHCASDDFTHNNTNGKYTQVRNTIASHSVNGFCSYDR